MSITTPREGRREFPDASLIAVVFGGLVALVWALHTPDTADLAAQAYRADLFARHGFLLWDNYWYGGHYVPGYSLVYPALAAALGLRWTGILLVPVAAYAFAELLRTTQARARRLAAAWFALALAGEIVIGRLTFLLGVTVALWAVLALVRGRPRASALLTAIAAVSSPVAGAFLVLVGVAVALGTRRAAGAVTALVAASAVIALAVLAPDGGVQPFAVESFVVAVGFAGVFLWFVRAQPGVLRWGAFLYLGAIVTCYVVPTPVGSNVVRLGVLFAGPVLLAAPRVRLSPGLACVLAAAVVYQAFGPFVELSKSDDTPSRAAVYVPLLRQLELRHAGSQRIEIVPTMTRWEVVRVAERFALARGWETQLDRQRNGLFFGAQALTSTSYRRWLGRNAVGYVVLPEMPLERWGRAEGRLVRQGLPYLRLVWRREPWRLYRVTDSAPLVGGATSGARLTHDALTFKAVAPGEVVARVRFTPQWTVTSGRACVRRVAGGMTGITVIRPGPVTIAARWGDGSPCPE